MEDILISELRLYAIWRGYWSEQKTQILMAFSYRGKLVHWQRFTGMVEVRNNYVLMKSRVVLIRHIGLY